MKGSGLKRGALIVFEGCDKAGKTTQCRKLVETLWESGITAQMMQFPERGMKLIQGDEDVTLWYELTFRINFVSHCNWFADRTTATGRIISNYLAKKEELPDQAVHLLFSANRWESQPKMKQLLQEGVTLVVDRYSFSGVAYSAAKPGMDFDWCHKPEIGLPKPDLVFLLHVPADATNERNGFGEERYENKEFLQHVYSNYLKMKDDTWMVIDASKSIEEVHEELVMHAKEVLKEAQIKELGFL